MTTIVLPQIPVRIAVETETPLAAAVREGLAAGPKRLPAWLFYDAEGSRLFDQITQLPEYYLTRTERGIFSAHAGDIVARAAQCDPGATEDKPARLRIAELGAGSADKTRLLLRAAAARQGTLLYEPVDVSSSALQAARERIEGEIPGVHVLPRVMDYTRGFDLYPAAHGERRLVLYIGSSIGNFEPQQASEVLEIIRSGLEPGDALLLGVDLRKDESTLLAAYDDAAGVTARFNLNLLARLNRELGADFDLESFSHRAVWNPAESRIEMHLESLIDQRVKLPALDLEAEFESGERIHTENSYKYAPGQAEEMLSEAGFRPESTWTDPRVWFAVCLGRAE
jgi:L-histidine N-alpha-methyltransferase